MTKEMMRNRLRKVTTTTTMTMVMMIIMMVLVISRLKSAKQLNPRKNGHVNHVISKQNIKVASIAIDESTMIPYFAARNVPADFTATVDYGYTWTPCTVTDFPARTAPRHLEAKKDFEITWRRSKAWFDLIAIFVGRLFLTGLTSNIIWIHTQETRNMNVLNVANRTCTNRH